MMLSPVRWTMLLYYRLIRLRERPHFVAMGLAWGILIGWTPTIPLQMTMAVIITFIFRCSKLAAVIGVQFSNYITLPAVYYADYLVGGWVTGRWPEFSLRMAHKIDLWHQAGEVFWVMMVGGVIIGIPSAIATYFITRRLLIKAQQKRSAKTARKISDDPTA